MGWQSISYFAYGMILSPNDSPHQDVLRGLQWLIHEQQFTPDDETPAYIDRPTCRPDVHWIGTVIGSKTHNIVPKFPPQAPLRAWPVTDPYVAPAVVIQPDPTMLSSARIEWEKFERWCYKRGVDIRGRGQLLVVNDYD